MTTCLYRIISDFFLNFYSCKQCDVIIVYFVFGIIENLGMSKSVWEDLHGLYSNIKIHYVRFLVILHFDINAMARGGEQEQIPCACQRISNSVLGNG